MIDLLVDGVMLSAPSSLRGVGTYIRAVTPRLAALPDFRVRMLLTSAASPPPSVEAVPIQRRLPSALQFLEQSLLLPRDIRRAGADIFHSPAIDPPRRSSVPWVQTLLDVTPLAFAHREFRLRRMLWHARAARIRDAAAVIAISQRSADDGIRHLGLDPRRVHVIHLGVEPRITPRAPRQRPEAPYLLSVSGYGPNKGFSEAFSVVAALAERGHPLHLKVVGGVAPRTREKLERMAQQAGRPDLIEFLGYVTQERLRDLYDQAALVPITSRYEGFCLPAIEAMAAGTPVVAFANSALPEVVGDGGVLVPDGDVRAFVDAAVNVLTEEAHWKELSEAGMGRAERFSWDHCADAHAEVFRAVAARG